MIHLLAFIGLLWALVLVTVMVAIASKAMLMTRPLIEEKLLVVLVAMAMTRTMKTLFPQQPSSITMANEGFLCVSIAGC